MTYDLTPHPTPVSDRIARMIHSRSPKPKEFLVSLELYALFLEEQSRLQIGFRDGETFHGVKIQPDV